MRKNYTLGFIFVAIILITFTGCQYIERMTRLPKVATWIQGALEQHGRINTAIVLPYDKMRFSERFAFKLVNGCSAQIVFDRVSVGTGEGYVHTTQSLPSERKSTTTCTFELGDIALSDIISKRRDGTDAWPNTDMLYRYQGFPYWEVTLTTTGHQKRISCQTQDNKGTRTELKDDEFMRLSSEEPASKLVAAFKDAVQLCGGKKDLY